MKKEKRYFCNIVNKVIKNKFVVCSFTILTLVLTTYLHFNYNPDICNANWRNSYNEEKKEYDYFLSIAENTIIEGERIDINAIPEDVYFSISSNKDTIVYYYYVGSSSDKNMTITLSKDLKILDKESGFILLEEERYKKFFDFSNLLISCIYGFITTFLFFLASLIVLAVPYILSSTHKYSDIASS